ncbi:hypothetical protein BTH42_10735 [Burkholderia sp. SRS-W-2-2016]|uniref:hypothetical protein n=1 Tax=Burkholderia sp. SRS-W-2-2016 TaxID=1926878 RepID=UPI00094AECA6|nr:hypothetical protein [Burkholderia sp. SRS-W-2-2016]OLL31774.1 hypothetical protein BTH42_10735 [Burkholderia sp. SRS-W-2-2016]
MLQDAEYAIARHTETLQAEEFRASWFDVIGFPDDGGLIQEALDEASDATRSCMAGRKAEQAGRVKA